MARVSKAARRRRNLERLSALGLGVVLLGAIGGAGYLYAQRDRAPDPLTLCPASGPAGHYVVLIDNTDPYNFMQRQAFTEKLKSLVKERVPEGYLLSVYVLGADFTQNSAPLFEKCNPGKGEGKSEMTANLERLRRRFDSEFMAPVVGLADDILIDAPASRSPIFEMLQIASINGFHAHDVWGERVLVMFSDMLPNTEEFSMFKGTPEFERFLGSDYGRKSQTELNGVKVELNYLLKYPKLQTKRQLGFWEAFFEHTGARVVAVNTLEG